MRCCPTHDGIDLAIEALREALDRPILSDKSRRWLEEKLVEMAEKQSVVVQDRDGSFHSRKSAIGG